MTRPENSTKNRLTGEKHIIFFNFNIWHGMGAFIEIKSRPKEADSFDSFIPFQQIMINYGAVTRQRKKGFGLGVVNCEKVTRKYMGNSNGRYGLF